MSINNLKSKIQHRDARIAIIGLGYVGLPLAIRFSEEGFQTIGFDIDDSKVKMLNEGKSYIKHINEGDISGIVSSFMLIGLPLFLGYESKNPVFFGMYSAKLMIVNTVYVLMLLFSSGLFIHITRKNAK